MPHEPRCTGTKTCTKCGQEKHVLEFRHDPKNTNGLKSECRKCECAWNRKNKRKKAALDYKTQKSIADNVPYE